MKRKLSIMMYFVSLLVIVRFGFGRLFTVFCASQGWDPNRLVDVNLKEATFKEICLYLESLTKLPVVAVEPIKPLRVTLEVRNQSVSKVLDTISKQAGWVWDVKSGVLLLKESPPAPPHGYAETEDTKRLVNFLLTLTDEHARILAAGEPVSVTELTSQERNVLHSMLGQEVTLQAGEVKLLSLIWMPILYVDFTPRLREFVGSENEFIHLRLGKWYALAYVEDDNGVFRSIPMSAHQNLKQ